MDVSNGHAQNLLNFIGSFSLKDLAYLCFPYHFSSQIATLGSLENGKIKATDIQYPSNCDLLESLGDKLGKKPNLTT